jgi:hypothetical protein
MRRLALYHISEHEAQNLPKLTVGKHKHVVLDRSSASPLQPRLIKFTTLAALRQLLVVPDDVGDAAFEHAGAVVAKWKPASEPLKHAIAHGGALGEIKLQELHPEDRVHLQQVAKAALGNHPAARPYEHIVEWFLKSISLEIAAFAASEVFVNDGGVLELTNAVNVLVANRVHIESTARIVGYGTFTVNCVTLFTS